MVQSLISMLQCKLMCGQITERSEVAQSCLTLCSPVDYRQPASSLVFLCLKHSSRGPCMLA